MFVVQRFYWQIGRCKGLTVANDQPLAVPVRKVDLVNQAFLLLLVVNEGIEEVNEIVEVKEVMEIEVQRSRKVGL